MPKQTKRLESRSQFAATCGVSPAAITKACRNVLSAAKVRDRIDIDHPAAKKYARGHKRRPARAQMDPAKPAKAKARAKKKPGGPPRSDTAEPTELRSNAFDINDYLDLTLRELLDRFGTERTVKDWLEAAKKIEDVRSSRLASDKLQGKLISRELVKQHVFGWLDSGLRRLVTDSPRTISRRVYAAAKAGESLERAEAIVRELIESQLRPMKANAARILRKG